MKIKSFKFTKTKFESKDGSPYALFDGFGSTYDGIPDSYNDVVDPGAFTKTIQEWQKKIDGGRLLPMLYQHSFFDPIGGYPNLSDSTGGLKVTDSQINLKVQKGVETAALLDQGVIGALSIGYETIKEAKDSKDVNHLQEIKLYEISPVVFPANENALITAVKSKGFMDNLDAAIQFFEKLKSFNKPEFLHLLALAEPKEIIHSDEQMKEFLTALKKEFQTT